MAERWSSLAGLKEEAERFFSEYLGKGGLCRQPLWDFIERPGEFVLLVEMAGVGRESIDIRAGGGTLTIRGEKTQEPPQLDETWHVAERSYGPFSRSLTLPAGVEAAAARAEYRDGVLRVVLPKSPEAEARKIQVEPST
jgi:HSP20 family protein